MLRHCPEIGFNWELGLLCNKPVKLVVSEERCCAGNEGPVGLLEWVMVMRVNVGRLDVGWYLSGMMWVSMMRRHPCGKI